MLYPDRAVNPPPFLLALLQPQQQVRWVQAPSWSIRRGQWWIQSPRLLAVLVLAVVVALVGVALYRRVRRR